MERINKMKKLFILPLALVMLFTFGCAGNVAGVSQEQYDAVIAERDALKEEVDKLLSTASPEPTPEISSDGIERAIRFFALYTSSPNSAGGVDVNANFCSFEKNIDYVYLWVTAYDRVGNVTECRIRHESQFTLKATGPYLSERLSTTTWENVWYNSTIGKCIVDKIRVEFSDGEVLESEDFLSVYTNGRISSNTWHLSFYDDIVRPAIELTLEEKKITPEQFIADYEAANPETFEDAAANLFGDGNILGVSFYTCLNFCAVLGIEPVDLFLRF